MFVCKNCGQTYSVQTKFCSVCGSSAIEAQFTAPQPQPVQPQPVYGGAPMYATPVRKPREKMSPAKVYGLYGGFAGIASALFAVMSLVFIIMAFCAEGPNKNSYEYEALEGYSLIIVSTLCCLFAFVLGTTSLILTTKATDAGENNQLISLGSKLGIISAVLGVVLFVMVMIAVFVTYAGDWPTQTNGFNF